MPTRVHFKSLPGGRGGISWNIKNIVFGPLSQGQVLFNYLLSLPFTKGCHTTFYMERLNLCCSWKVDIYQFPNIYFELDGVTLVLYPKNYFYKEYAMGNEEYVYKGRFQFGKNDFFWGFGQSILKEYDMIFDMDEGSVGFWNIEHKKESDKYLLVKILGIISIIVVICLIIYSSTLFIIRKIKETEINKEKEKLLTKIEVMQEITSIPTNKETSE